MSFVPSACAARTVLRTSVSTYLSKSTYLLCDWSGWSRSLILPIREPMLATLTDWLAAIPEAVDDQHPRLRYLRGISALARGDSAGVDAILDHSLRAYESLDDRENVTAHYDSGVLRLTFPKTEAAKDRSIQVTGK